MKKGEKIFSYLIILLSLAFLTGSFFIIPFSDLTVSSAGGFPIFIAVLCLLMALFATFGKRPPLREEDQMDKNVFDSVIKAFIIMLIIYVLAIVYIHYVPATLIFLFAAVFYLKKDWKSAVMVSYISTFMILLVFKYLFSVIMP